MKLSLRNNQIQQLAINNDTSARIEKAIQTEEYRSASISASLNPEENQPSPPDVETGASYASSAMAVGKAAGNTVVGVARGVGNTGLAVGSVAGNVARGAGNVAGNVVGGVVGNVARGAGIVARGAGGYMVDSARVNTANYLGVMENTHAFLQGGGGRMDTGVGFSPVSDRYTEAEFNRQAELMEHDIEQRRIATKPGEMASRVRAQLSEDNQRYDNSMVQFINASGPSSSNQYVTGQTMPPLGNSVIRHQIGTPPETDTDDQSQRAITDQPKKQRLRRIKPSPPVCHKNK